MSGLTLTVTKNQKKKFDIYPALILSEIINEAVPEKSVAFGYKDADFLVKGNDDSAVGLDVEGGETIYGAQPIIKKLIESFPDVLKTADESLVRRRHLRLFGLWEKVVLADSVVRRFKPKSTVPTSPSLPPTTRPSPPLSKTLRIPSLSAPTSSDIPQPSPMPLFSVTSRAA